MIDMKLTAERKLKNNNIRTSGIVSPEQSSSFDVIGKKDINLNSQKNNA